MGTPPKRVQYWHSDNIHQARAILRLLDVYTDSSNINKVWDRVNSTGSYHEGSWAILANDDGSYAIYYAWR